MSPITQLTKRQSKRIIITAATALVAGCAQPILAVDYPQAPVPGADPSNNTPVASEQPPAANEPAQAISQPPIPVTTEEPTQATSQPPIPAMNEAATPAVSQPQIPAMNEAATPAVSQPPIPAPAPTDAPLTSEQLNALMQPQEQINDAKTDNFDYQKRLKEWKALQKKGEETFYLCQYGVAERTLKKAVMLARSFGPGDLQFAKSSGELGRLLTIRGRFDEAEKYLQEEMCLIDLAVDSEKSKMVKTMAEMVSFYLEYGTKEKAYPLADDLIAFIENKIREVHQQKSGKITLKDGQLTGWAGMAKPEDRDPLLEWSILLDKLGYEFRVNGDLDIADRLFKAALDIKSTVLGKKHLSLANSYDNLGTVCLTRKDYKEAESYYQEALTITDRILDPGNPERFSRLSKLALSKMGQKKYSETRELYERARNEFAGHPGIQEQALYKLGCLYSDAKNYSAAAPILRQALNLAIKNHGSCSIQLVPFLRKYAYVSYYCGNKGKMTALKSRADNINPHVQALTPSVQMKAGNWEDKKK